MVGEKAVHRHEQKTFRLALPQEQTIEWIARPWFGFNSLDDVGNADRHDGKAGGLQYRGHIVQRHARIEFAKPPLDRDLP